MDEQHNFSRNAPEWVSMVGPSDGQKGLAVPTEARTPIVCAIRTEKPGSGRFCRSTYAEIFGGDHKRPLVGAKLEIVRRTARKRNLPRSIRARLIPNGDSASGRPGGKATWLYRSTRHSSLFDPPADSLSR